MNSYVDNIDTFDLLEYTLPSEIDTLGYREQVAEKRRSG